VAKRAKGGGDKRVLFAKLDQIWSEVSVADWLLMAAELRPESMFTRHGPHVKGRCPFHDDPGPSFCITPVSHRGTGIAKCFGCNRLFTDPVKLVAALRRCNHGDAILFLRKRFGLKSVIPEALFERVRDHERHQQLKGDIADFMSSQLLEAIRLWPSEEALGKAQLYWAKPTVDYLMSRRLGETAPGELRPAGETTPAGPDPWGVWQAICGSQLVGVLPPLATVQGHFGVDSETFKFYSSYFDKFLAEGNKFVGWVVFMMHDGPRSVCRMKIRSPNDLKEMFFVDDAYEAEMGGFRGFFGLNYYRTYLGPKSPDDSYTRTVHAHEGEFDSLSAIAQQIRRGTDDFVALGLGGGSAQPLDRLVNYGVSRARIVPDDDAGGVDFTKNCLERTRTKLISFQVFAWPDEYKTWTDPTNPSKRIKDADEAVKTLGYPRWARVVDDPDCYSSMHEWCFDRVVDDVRRTAVNDVRQQSRIAQEWGQLVTDRQELGRFCKDVERTYDLDARILERDICAKDEDEEAFIERLGRALLEHFYPVGVQNAEGRKRLLILWNKSTRAMDSVVLNDERGVETLLSRYFGALYEFVREHVGDPSFLSMEGEEAALPIPIKIKRYREYLTLALLRMARGLPSLDISGSKGQGIHLAHVDGPALRSYLVNGRDVFCLEHASDGGFSAFLLDGPSHEGVVFNTDGSVDSNRGGAWLPGLTLDQVLAKVDVVDLFVRLREMINDGWSWRHQGLDATFLAAYVMCLPVMTAFKRQTSIFVTAESTSGKSRFVSGFIGGSGFSSINIVAHALAMSQYTPASIRQMRNGSSLCLCLEEFEDYGNNERKAVQVRGVLEMTRDLISENAANISIGTTSGEAKTYHLRFPMVAAAIRPLRDAASLSRFVTFELVHDSARVDPAVVLIERYGEIGIRSTRRDLAVGLLRHMAELRSVQTKVESEFASGALLPPHAQARFREALYPVLTMLRFLSEEAVRTGKKADLIPDHKRFATDFSNSRRDQLTRLKATSENEQIFETILGSVIHLQSDRNSERISNGTTIRIMLASLNELDDINKTKQGVYLDIKMEWLIVNWVEAQQGVLSNTRYKQDSPTFLKQVSERSPHHVAPDQVRDSRTLERLVDVMGPCQKLELITAFSIRHLLDAVRKRRDDAFLPIATSIAQPDPGAGETPQQSEDFIA